MREIKFRGKRIDTGEMIYGNLSIEFDGTHRISYWKSVLMEPENNYFEMQEFYFDVIPETVGQFTGLKDTKNGKEIYEGDILGIYWEGIDDYSTEPISYDEKYGYFKYGNNPICELIDTESYEVIGNIYEILN